jgi:hypothetical protein
VLSRAWRNGSFNSSAVMIWWSYAVCTCTSTAGLKNRAEATLATCCAKYLRVVEDESITTASLPSSKDGALAIPTDGRFATRVCGGSLRVVARCIGCVLGRAYRATQDSHQRRDEDRGGGWPYRVSALLAHPLR